MNTIREEAVSKVEELTKWLFSQDIGYTISINLDYGGMGEMLDWSNYRPGKGSPPIGEMMEDPAQPAAGEE